MEDVNQDGLGSHVMLVRIINSITQTESCNVHSHIVK